jgi:hypothetical protein
MTKKSTFVLAATVIALSAGLVYFVVARYAPEQVGASVMTERDVAIGPKSGVHAAIHPGGNLAQPNVMGSPIRINLGRSEVAMGDPIQAPKSQEELLWLRRNGYPSDEALKDAINNGPPSINDLVLEDGISAWELVRAEQIALLDPQNRKQAISFLQEAANQGSIYALQALGLVYGDPRSGNVVQSEAYYKAAAMRGDWSAHMRITQVQPSAEQAFISSLMAHQILESMDQSRKAKGLQALGVDPRPDVNDFLVKLYEEAMKKK